MASCIGAERIPIFASGVLCCVCVLLQWVRGGDDRLRQLRRQTAGENRSRTAAAAERQTIISTLVSRRASCGAYRSRMPRRVVYSSNPSEPPRVPHLYPDSWSFAKESVCSQLTGCVTY
ncbi:unnamed protein product [Heligmosomoides polygyrus]|uniref:Uncharacterized protein n=1 Tax=Heligmosomoides polygyrus TaxID=6339 RepID=A0A3P7UGI8_HELPZ|nr:unnamed protein product [Heligmosomoides polygyrus]